MKRLFEDVDFGVNESFSVQPTKKRKQSQQSQQQHHHHHHRQQQQQFIQLPSTIVTAFKNQADNDAFLLILGALKSISWHDIYSIDIPHDILHVIAYHTTGTIIPCDICNLTETLIMNDSSFCQDLDKGKPEICAIKTCSKRLICCYQKEEKKCSLCQRVYCFNCFNTIYKRCFNSLCDKIVCNNCANGCEKCFMVYCDRCNVDNFGDIYVKKCGNNKCGESNCSTCVFRQECLYCNKEFCQECKSEWWCDKCQQGYCGDCQPLALETTCDDCGDIFCSDCKKTGFICNKCNLYYCQACNKNRGPGKVMNQYSDDHGRKAITCKRCNGYSII